jgi:hypothetical protein
VGHSKGSVKRDVYNYEHPHKKIKSQINNLLIHLKLLIKQAQANPKSNTWKEIIKIRAEINVLENKRTT